MHIGDNKWLHGVIEKSTFKNYNKYIWAHNSNHPDINRQENSTEKENI